MDSASWADTSGLGMAVRKVFLEEVPCLPQPEPMFTVRSVRPHQFNSLLKECRNVVMVTIFGSNTYDNQLLKKYFTKESISVLESDTSRFMIVQQDQFATNQVLVHLFAKDEASLIVHLNKNKKQIQEVFNNEEKRRLTKEVLEDKANLPLAKNVGEKFGFQMHIPSGFVIAKNEKDFVWLRHPEAKFDRNVFVSVKSYTSENQFNPDSILNWRTEIGKKYLQDPDNPNYYMTTESLVKPLTEPTQLNGQYALKIRGLWRLKDRFVGGAFISYALTNKASNKIYYVEGFIMAAGEEKREFIRELDVIISTFQAK
ncbi:MAG: DUF4837 family protein [Flammeovirgaceae bacterium]